MVFILAPFGREDRTLRVSFLLELITMLRADNPMVGQVGLEPTMLKATGLQPAALPIPLTDPYNALSNIHPTSILTAYRRR